MKKFYYLLASFAIVLVTMIACETDSIGIEETQAVQDEEVLLAREMTKSDICHWDADAGVFFIINIADAAYDKHIAHGDKEPEIYYEDLDGDGFGNPDVYVGVCEAPDGFVPNSTDCNDSDASINPDAVEICGDGIDNNCNEEVDENAYTPLGEIYFYYETGGILKGLHSMDINNWDGTNFSGTGLNLNSNGGNYYNAVSAVVSGTVDPVTHDFLGTLYYPDGNPTSNTYKFYGTITECSGIVLDDVIGEFYGPVSLGDYDSDGDGFSGLPIPN